MEHLPHRYKVGASADTEGSVTISSDMLPSLTTAPPRQFGGPGNQWSPETLLVAAVAESVGFEKEGDAAEAVPVSQKVTEQEHIGDGAGPEGWPEQGQQEEREPDF